MPQFPFCPITGNQHQASSSGPFCPSCGSQVDLTEEDIPKRPKEEEDTSAKSKALLISGAKSEPRAAAEISRQESVQRTVSSRPKPGIPLKGITATVMVLVARYIHHETYGDIFQDSRLLHKTRVYIAPRTFDSLQEFIQDCLLSELQRLEQVLGSKLRTSLATEVTKDGPVYLPLSAEQLGSTKELFESNYFRKDKSGSYKIYLLFEEVEQ